MSRTKPPKANRTSEKVFIEKNARSTATMILRMVLLALPRSFAAFSFFQKKLKVARNSLLRTRSQNVVRKSVKNISRVTL